VKKLFWLPVFLAVLIGAGVAYANTGPDPVFRPEDVLVWEYDSLICVTDVRADGPHTSCYCRCEDGCAAETPENGSLRPTEAIGKPQPTENAPVKCNAGRGNGSEGNPDCDPGNSGKNQGGD